MEANDYFWFKIQMWKLPYSMDPVGGGEEENTNESNRSTIQHKRSTSDWGSLSFKTQNEATICSVSTHFPQKGREQTKIVKAQSSTNEAQMNEDIQIQKWELGKRRHL